MHLGSSWTLDTGCTRLPPATESRSLPGMEPAQTTRSDSSWPQDIVCTRWRLVTERILLLDRESAQKMH